MTLVKKSQLRFTGITLNNWRNFRTVSLNLQDRAFFVGPNASGKSNLLDAFKFLAEIARPGSGGLQAAIDVRGGFSAVRCLQARRPPEIEFLISIGSNHEQEAWQYKLKINRIKSEKIPTVSEEEIIRSGSTIVHRVRKPEDDALEFSQTFMEQVNVNKDFRDLAQFLSSCRYLHVVPQIIRDRSRARPEGEDPFGGDLLRRMKDMPKKTRIPRLRRISQALNIAVPQFREMTLEDDKNGVPHLYASYEHWRHSPTKQSEIAFSDGTLRLIGLLWSIAERGGPLLLEEPELSLNDSVISQLPRMFNTMQRLSSRQVIATTHSTALLEDPGLSLKEVHVISVGPNGSVIETIADNMMIKAQIEGGMTISQAVIPLLRPNNIESLGDINVAA